MNGSWNFFQIYGGGVDVRRTGEQDLGDVAISRKYFLTASWAFVKHFWQYVCVRGKSPGFTPCVCRYDRCVTQRSRSGEDSVPSRMSPQTQQTGSSVGAMNVSLIGAGGASQVL